MTAVNKIIDYFLSLFRISRDPECCNTYDRPKDETECCKCEHEQSCGCEDWVG